MPNGNLLAPFRMLERRGFQPLDVGQSLYKRGLNELAVEERRQRMGLAESQERRAEETAGRAARGEVRDIETGILAKKRVGLEERRLEVQEAGLTLEQQEAVAEELDYFIGLLRTADSEEKFNAATRLSEARSPGNAAVIDQLFPEGYDEKTRKLLMGVAEQEREMIFGRVTPEMADYFAVHGGFPKTEDDWTEFLKGIGKGKKPAEVKGPELSQAVKDVLAEKGLTELTASPVDIKAAREQIRKEGKKPKEADQITMTDVPTGRKIKVRRGSEEHTNAEALGFIEGEYPAGRLPLTPEQKREKYSDRIRVLVNNIAKLQSTGGADPLALMLFADDPKIIEKLTSGEGVEEAVKELQGQLRRVTALRDALLTPRERAVQALENAGAPVTEGNIAEAMRQLGGR